MKFLCLHGAYGNIPVSIVLAAVSLWILDSNLLEDCSHPAGTDDRAP